MTGIELLVSRAGPPLSSGRVPSTDFWLGDIGKELAALLCDRNGFFGFLSALHVFPLSEAADCVGYDLKSWNEPDLWRGSYPSDDPSLLMFAEDVFGFQFGISNVGVVSFDSETGETTLVATTLEDWARSILNDSEILTGWPLAKDWQERFGPLDAKQRLIPRIPFVLGGEFNIENLAAMDAVEAMRFRGDLAGQMKDAPDGTKVAIKITP
jgi:hypothetical protein